ncbi:MAG TPA: cytochrome c [Terracidiphilus sp.]|nr:cytochrome c [Terracidiphilus sp.]
MGRFISGLIIGIILVPLGVWAWFRWGNPPVAVADHPLPFEKQITSVPLHARIDREMPKNAPIQPTADNLIAGAQIYSDNCAFCHGLQGKPSEFGAHMFPGAPQLWRKHPHGDVVGVSDDPPGETFWKVANGIRLTGMPAFDHTLSNEQMWQVTLLLANANKPLPPEAKVMVSPPAANPPAPPAAAAPAKNR